MLFVGKLQILLKLRYESGGRKDNLSTSHKLRRTNVIEVNHWAKVANKTANINVKKRSLYASNGSTLTLRQFHAAYTISRF